MNNQDNNQNKSDNQDKLDLFPKDHKDHKDHKIICESCDPWEKDVCCAGIKYGCKIIIKPMIYDNMPVVIIIVPEKEHKPFWELSEISVLNMHKVVQEVSNVLINRGQFPNFFTGGNINYAKYGLKGVHAHIHIEARVKEDPAYNTFPTHLNRKMLNPDEIDTLKKEWKLALSL